MRAAFNNFSWSNALKWMRRLMPTEAKTWSFLLFSSLCFGQSLSPTLSEPFSYPGSTVILTLSYANNVTNAGIAGFSWTITMPTGFTMGTLVQGAATIAAGETVQCNPATFTCTTSAQTTNSYAPGVVVIIPITLTAAAPVGPQQVSLTNLVASTSAGTAVPISTTPTTIQVDASTGTTPWFSVSIGQATCRASKVAQTPIRISWVCFNLYGANSGSYTADLNNGGNGTDYFDIGINSFALTTSTVPDAFLRCTLQINATSSTVTMLNGATVPANSAAYNCSGYSQSGPMVLSWP
jgi:hypothetical protein